MSAASVLVLFTILVIGSIADSVTVPLEHANELAQVAFWLLHSPMAVQR